MEPEHPIKISAPLLFWALQGQQGAGRESWARNAGWASREFCSWCRNKKEWDLSTSATYTAGLNRPVLFPFSRTQRSCSLLRCLLPEQTQVGISKARAARRDAADESSQGEKKKKKDKQPKQEGNTLVLNPVYFNFISLTLPGGFQRPAQADFNLPISGLIRNTHR